MRWIFWCSLGFVAYAMAGYPLLLYIRSRWFRRPVLRASIFPTISVVMAVHNEAEVLPRKLKNLQELEYPTEQVEIIVVSDGSTDSTAEVLRRYQNGRLQAIICQEHGGKASALNRGVEAARGEIVVFTDARQMIEPRAMRELVSNFADPSVGCVSGELMLTESGEAGPAKGLGLYWEIEKRVRQWESATGSVIGASGALYAVRRSAIVPLPPWTILDDLYIPLHVIRRGGRSLFEPRARFYDKVASGDHEFRRKVRTLTGNYQLLQLAPWLLGRFNPVRFDYFCHKLLRLVVPFALMGVLVTSAFLPGLLFKIALTIQVVLYGLAGWAVFRRGAGLVSRLAAACLAFLVLNIAATVALFWFVGRKKAVWVR